MSTVKSLCCLKTAAATSRSGFATVLTVPTSLVCRRPLILSLLEAGRISAATSMVCRRPLIFSLLEDGRKTLEVFFCGCKFVFLSDAAALCSLTGGVCAAEDRLRSAGVSTRCVMFIIGVAVLDVVPLVGKSVPYNHHCIIHYAVQYS